MTNERDEKDAASAGSACGGCALATSSRRAFLADGARAAAAALLALGVSPHALRALEPGSVSGRPGPDGSVSYTTPPADGATIDREHQVILVRFAGAVYAFGLSCPHQNTALRWNPGETRFQCPKHKSRYTPEGTFISGRATRGMDRYAIRQGPGGLTVDLTTLYHEDENAAAWKAALVRV